MPKLNLDKYYTDQTIVDFCLAELAKLNLPITEYLEPSAGAGAFSLKLPEGSLAFDIEPEHESIVKQDFLSLDLPYKEGRCVIGNPPFGTRNTLSVKFFKKAIQLGDFVAFILPISQAGVSMQLYEFDLVKSIVLPVVSFSGIKLACCFNIYQRPPKGLNNKPNYTLKDITVGDFRRGGKSRQVEFDYAFCAWGAAVGTEVTTLGTYALELYIVIHNKNLKDKIINLCKTTDWKTIKGSISTPKLAQWHILKYLKEQIPELQ